MFDALFASANSVVHGGGISFVLWMKHQKSERCEDLLLTACVNNVCGYSISNLQDQDQSKQDSESQLVCYRSTLALD